MEQQELGFIPIMKGPPPLSNPIPMFNENEYKSLIDLHEYVSNDLKRKFIHDDQVYDTNYDLMADWKTKAVVHLFVAAEVIQFCCKWIQ